MTVRDLNGVTVKDSKILFFSPSFFKYEDLIVAKMRSMGAQVDAYDTRSVSSALSRALLKVFPGLFRFRTRKYYERIIAENRDKDYDYILIVKCDMTPVHILQKLKTVFPHAKLCLYLWDSIANIPGVTGKFPYFDTLHSFDMNDCQSHAELKFRPLFFADPFRKEAKGSNDYKYDISFLGTVHSDRYAVIEQVREIAQENGLRCFWFLYLQSRFIYRFYKIFKKEFRFAPESVFSFRKMSAAEIAKVVDESRVILDIQHPRQTGLTMRTVEMIGMNKKLITTNESIRQYDFYDPDNIAVIDRKNVSIPEGFFEAPYAPLEETVYEKYSLKNWILDVLD